jgi:hypothetical protein
MSSQLFTEYISTVLLPYFDELRPNEEFADNEAAPLMDNCSVHVQGDTLQMSADHRVKMLRFPPHTTHIFQSINLSLFRSFKKRMNDRQPLETDETTAGFIKRNFHMMKQTLVENNVRSSFVQFCLTYDIDTNLYELIFDEHVLRQSPGFTSLWERGYPIEKPSQRRGNATFGWINKMICPDWDSREENCISLIWSYTGILFHLTNDHCRH